MIFNRLWFPIRNKFSFANADLLKYTNIRRANSKVKFSKLIFGSFKKRFGKGYFEFFILFRDIVLAVTNSSFTVVREINWGAW